MKKPPRGKPRCVVLGGGGHAKVVIDCLLLQKATNLVAVLDQDASRWKTKIQGVPITGSDETLPALRRQGVTHFVLGIGGAGNNRPRKELYDHCLALGFRVLSVIHPSAILSSQARWGEGVQLLPGCIVNADAVLGDNVIVNSGAIVEHDSQIASHVHIATGARLASGVVVGEGAHIGAGATVRQGIHVGAYAVVGAGAAVVADVPAEKTVVGVPATVKSQ